MSAGNVGRSLAIAASAVVIATVVAAMVLMGSPESQRESRLDRKREQDMDSIATAINSRAREGKPLPASLEILSSEPGLRLAVSDPQTRETYSYAITGSDRYRLCAVFATDTGDKSRQGRVDQDWLHGAGRHCFERKVEPRET